MATAAALMALVSRLSAEAHFIAVVLLTPIATKPSCVRLSRLAGTPRFGPLRSLLPDAIIAVRGEIATAVPRLASEM
jgi:hypothetical protein